MAKDFQMALGRIEQAEQQFNGSGLAGTIGSQQPEHLAAPDLEIDVIDRARLGPAPKILEDFGQAADSDDHLAGGPGGLRGWEIFKRGHKGNNFKSDRSGIQVFGTNASPRL